MKGGSAARCRRIPTTCGMSRPAHIKPKCRTPATCSRRVRLMFMTSSLGCADEREHRQDDVSNKWRRKKPERRGRGNADGEQTAAPATSESDPPRQSRALARDSQPLEHEIPCGEPVATVRGY